METVRAFIRLFIGANGSKRVSFFYSNNEQNTFFAGKLLWHGTMLVLALSIATAASAQVYVSSPSSGATVGSPIHVAASAKSSRGIASMRIYLDSRSVFLAYASQINTYISASAGTHNLVIQAWDTAGAVVKAPLTVTVSGTALTGTTTTFNNVQQWTGWQTCGNCGNDSATGKVASYEMIRGISYPSLSGSSAEFKIGGPYPYTNGYWLYRHDPVNAPLKYLKYEFDLYVPAASANAPEAIEFECQERLNGYVYNFAWQAMYSESRWRVFNYTLSRWEDSGIPLQHFSPGTWHHIIAEYHNDASTHTTYHDALTVDGVRHVVSIAHKAAYVGNLGNEFTNAFQLDLNGVPTAFNVYVDRMRVTYLK